LLIGPIFNREVAVAPRRAGIYVMRSAYVLAILVLICTAYLVLTGTQLVRDVGDMARFGTILFQILAPLQLALALFFSAMLAASAVAQEKGRKTLVLLLLTNLSNSELVLGKLLASLLNVLVALAAALPLFMVTALLGGVSFGQICRVFAVTLAAVLACGSLGSTLAFWREKTYQTLAMTVLVLVLWLAVWEVVAMGALGDAWWGISCRTWAAGFSPWQAIIDATRTYVHADPALGVLQTPVHLFLVIAVSVSVTLNGVAVAMVRIWNPSRETRPTEPEADNGPQKGNMSGSPTTAPRSSTSGAPIPTSEEDTRTRHVWDNPIIWREMRTWAYGRKILLIRLAYLVLFGLAAGSLVWMVENDRLSEYADGAVALVPLLLLSLVLVNAQAVTALTSERDGRALDLLLVTDLSPKEIIFGKLGGVFFNTKEMVALPMLLCGYLWLNGALGSGSRGVENLVYLLGGLAVLYGFAAMLGVHAGMVYGNSQVAIAISLGTVFFLFVGVATCMRIMIAFSGSFQAQLQPFLAMMIGGGLALYLSLGARNPSPAIGVASFLCPPATFYAIASILLDPPRTLTVFLVTAVAYGFTTAAMLIPAVYEFDVATGRTTAEEP